VGDAGFEPVTSSVSGQNLCVGMRASVGPGACAGSPMSAAVRGGWPTVWPTVNRRHSVLTDVGRIVAVHESSAENQRAVSPVVTAGGVSPDLIRRMPISASQRRLVSPASSLPRACPWRCRRNLVIGGPGPCHVEQDQHKICAGNGSEDRGDQSYQSYATASAAKLSNGPTPDHRAFYD